MRHRPPVRTFLALALVAIGSRAPLSFAEDGTSKTYAEKNFRWSLPAGWVIEDAEGENKDAGYVCIARKEMESPSKGASAWALVVDAGGATLETLVTKATENKKQKLSDADSLPPGRTQWAGSADARMVQINGKSKDSGAAIQHRVYSTIVDGKLHQLDVKTWNGAEADLMTDLDAVAAGYHVLKGGSTKGGGGSNEGGGGDAPQGEVDPKKVRFDKFGLTWVLPTKEGIRNFSFVQAAASTFTMDPKTGYKLAEAHLDGDGPVVEINLSVELTEPGATTKGFINTEQNFEKLIKENFEGTPVPNLDEEYKVGNWHGAMKSFTGKDKAGKPLMVRTIYAVLREYLYVVRVWAHDKGETPAEGQIRDALGSLKWDNTVEGVRGPVNTPFAPMAIPRPEILDQGKDKVVAQGTNPIFSFKKPAVFGQITYNAMQLNTWQRATEARKPGAYMFFGIMRFNDAILRGSNPPLTANGLIDDLEDKWKNAVEEPKTQFAAGGNKVADTVAGVKGQKFEFTGTYEGYPFLERGWLLNVGTNIMLVRIQYGGKDAEAAFAAETKTMLSSLKFK